MTSLLTFIGGVLLLKVTWGLWAHGSFLMNALVLIGLPGAVALGVGKLPAGRNPFYTVVGASRWLAAPAFGHYAGRPFRLPRMCRVRHRLLIDQSAAASEPVTVDSEPAVEDPPPPRPPIHLLAAPSEVRR